MKARIAFLILAAWTHYSAALQFEGSIPPRQVTDRIIVKYHPTPTYGNAIAFIKQGATRGSFAVAAGKERDIVDLGASVNVGDARVLAEELAIDPQIDFAEPDYIMQTMQVPSDTRYNEQWHYYETIAGINLPSAWNITTGSSDVIVGVVDTGVVYHADLKDNLVQGYDFISHPWVANDGDGRDDNPYDAGDGITQIGACGTYNGQPVPGHPTTSSWHGTHVAGTIAAVSNNSKGVSGVAWNTKLMPLRALGRCGGYTSDVVDAMLWAAGFSVYGIAPNPTPVKVINLSLGGSAPSCPKLYQDAINKLHGAGVTVIVAAGNETRNAALASPANCGNVITVAAMDRDGDRSWYSNFGDDVDITAPGGDTLINGNGILSTSNNGLRSPTTDTYKYHQGTSMATPHVSGVAALVYAVNPDLSAQRVIEILQESARSFPPGSCTPQLCGSGVLDAAASVLNASDE